MSTLKTESPRNYLRFWLDGVNVGKKDAAEIMALPGYTEAIGLLDNVLVIGWGAEMLAKYNTDGRPAFGAFREWARRNCP